MADVGTHAAHLAEYISGLQITKICADLNIVVKDRLLDDDGNVLLKFNNGANGILMASQIAAGEENAIKIRVYGEKGGLEWHQMEPNTLLVKPHGAPVQVLRAGAGQAGLGAEASRRCRLPAGHPEGYLEAMGNLYRDFAAAIRAGEKGTPTGVPGIKAGMRGMAFIETVSSSQHSNEKWLHIPATN